MDICGLVSNGKMLYIIACMCESIPIRFIAGNQPKAELQSDLGDLADAAPKIENIMN